MSVNKADKVSGPGRFNSDEKKRLGSVLIAIPTAVLLLYLFWGGKSTKFDELALGEFTSSVFGRYKGVPVHCHDVSDADVCLGPAAKRSLSKSILWLGNSQLHGINKAKPGQQPASTLLAQKWRPRGVEVLSFSQPNASLREHYVLLEYLLSKRRFDVLLLPLVYDDTREGGIRQNVAVGADDGQVQRRLSSTDAGRAILKRIGSSLGADKKQKPKKTLQDRAEETITTMLETCCGWKTLRQEARGSIYRTIYDSRNRLFGIDPTTKRRRLPATYQSNLDALQGIIERARGQGVQVIAYIAPLRRDVPSPYVASEYTDFKQSVARILRAGNGHLLNLEDLVPGRFWGQEGKQGSNEGLDFMHFKYAGHALLGQALDRAIEKVLK